MSGGHLSKARATMEEGWEGRQGLVFDVAGLMLLALEGFTAWQEFFELVKSIGESRSKQEEDKIIVGEIAILKQHPSAPNISAKKMKAGSGMDQTLSLQILQLIDFGCRVLSSFGIYYSSKISLGGSQSIRCTKRGSRQINMKPSTSCNRMIASYNFCFIFETEPCSQHVRST